MQNDDAIVPAKTLDAHSAVMNDRRHVLAACIYDADRILLDLVNDTAQEENIPVREQLDFHAFLESKVFFVLFCHRLRLPMR